MNKLLQLLGLEVAFSLKNLVLQRSLDSALGHLKNALSRELVKNLIWFAGEATCTHSPMVHVSAALISWALCAYFTAATYIFNSSKGAFVINWTLHLTTFRAGGLCLC